MSQTRICRFLIAAVAMLEFTIPASGEEKENSIRIGAAWQDTRNPVAKLWDGQRLDHWALKVPIRMTVPSDGISSRASTAVDCFVQSKQQNVGLRLSKEADRRTLIRRATFDLIGLPPTVDEMLNFISDETSDAYERLVDRLLSSPQYGMRWGRHWLDVVRYADTNGYERDEFKSTMWRYRDYVIDSFNTDLPFDQFVHEQIAGDEMTSEESTDPRSQLRFTATGYLRLGPWDTTKSKFDTEEAGRDEILVDLTNTTGSAFLGQTLGCCRCHDHKTDPLLQADHYRLRAFFAGVVFDDEKVINSSEEEAKIAKHNAEVDTRLKPIMMTYRQTLQPGRERLRAQTLSSFPAEIVKLLALPEDHRDAATSQMLYPYLKKLDFYDVDVADQLTQAEKPAYLEALRLVRELEKEKRECDTIYCVKDKESDIPATHVLEGGAYADRREEVQPGIFSVLDPNVPEIVSPKNSKSTGRRTSLAQWIASERNPWTARVMVNRIWQHHFGRGIVATPDDFGYSGIAPSHPELLDWLAVEFVRSGWSIKHVHRLIMLSSTYRQSSQVSTESFAADPNNQWLSRQNMRRMDAETLRDSVLAVAGSLALVTTGPPLWPEVPEAVLRAQPGIYENAGRLQGYYTSPEKSTNVRSILLVRKRSVPMPFLSVFNLSDASGTCGRREVTNNAPQALSLLNNPLSTRAATLFASRLAVAHPESFQEQIDDAFWSAFGREASQEEFALLHQSCRMIIDRLKHRGENGTESSNRSNDPELDVGNARVLENSSVERLAFAELCRAILNSNEFIFIE